MKNIKMKYITRFGALLTMLAMTAALTSCTAKTDQPAVKIQEPGSPAAGNVTLSVAVDHFKLTTGDKKAQGRIIYYLDTAVPTYYEHSAMSKAGTFAVSNETAYTWSGVAPGEHTFSVQLVDNSNKPLSMPVVDSVTVNVAPPEGKPAAAIVLPADGASLPPGSILVTVNVGSFIISQKDMGVILHKGEGHLIYYIDETPPVDAGVPATTETAIVSSELSHLWKGVTKGHHTFSVQLVNNDDTPLDTPVVTTVGIDVA